ncbi:MAG: IS200/IS605 family transposase [Victivallales bacterium]|nr:IS200/IS605 family transposase [Victivallales bacterium]
MEIANHPKYYTEENDTVYSCQYHVIFCTKYRRKVLIDEISTHLKQIILDMQEEIGFTVQSIEVSLDHVHLIIDITPEQSVSSIITKIKGRTSHILRETYALLRSRIPTLWTRVIFVSSVGAVSLHEIESFMDKQKKR